MLILKLTLVMWAQYETVVDVEIESTRLKRQAFMSWWWGIENEGINLEYNNVIGRDMTAINFQVKTYFGPQSIE